MTYHKNEFAAGDGLRLLESCWLPEGEPAAVLVIVHGFTEHSGRYARRAEELSRRGYAVVAADLRGHGRSQGRRAFVDNFDRYVDDLESQIVRLRERWAGKPIFLFGHSMGGTIVLRLAIGRGATLREAGVRGLVLSAPALQVADGLFPFLRHLVGLIARLMPRLRVVRLGFLRISRDPRVVADFRDDPLVFHDRFPVRTGAEILRVLAEMRDQFSQLRLPLLVLQGTGDKVVDPRACRRLIAQAQSPDKELRFYEGYYHDLLHDIGWQAVFDDMAAWLDSRR